MNPADIVVGAVVGAAAGHYFGPSLSAVQKVRRRRAASRSEVPLGDVARSLLRYYAAKPDTMLYDFPCTTRPACTVPFLTGEALPTEEPLSSTSRDMVRFDAGRTPVAPVDQRLLRSHQRSGARLFDEPALAFEKFKRERDGVVVVTAAERYFACASAMLALEREACRNVRAAQRRGRERGEQWPIRDAQPSGMDVLFDGRALPSTVGVGVGITIDSPHGPRILLHSRSQETATYRTIKAVIPFFGLWPMEMPAADRIPVLYGCFLSEYAEELFGNRELEDRIASRRVDPLWFRSLDYVEQLEASLRDGEATLSVLGYGLDTFNGSATIALHLRILSEARASTMFKDATGNWEVDMDAEERPGVFLEPLDSPAIDRWVARTEMNFGSSYTIGRIREVEAKHGRI